MDHNDFARLVQSLNNAKDKHGNALKLVDILVSQGPRHFAHCFSQAQPVDVRSIAKPIVCLAVGIAIEKGLYMNGERVDLSTKIWPLLSRYATIRDPENEAKWQQVTFLDCLRITLGHDKGLVFSSDVAEQGEENLLDYVVNYPITRTVGKDFVYSNAGTFVISTLVTEYLGMQLDQWVAESLFVPLRISEYSWKSYGRYCAGCTGLTLRNADLHKVGKLIVQNGKYDGNQIVPRRWIDEMRKPQVASPTHRYIADRAFPKWSYGLNLWICEDGNYYCDGTEGQYMVVIADKKILITTLGFQSDTEPISHCLGMLK